MDEKVYLTQEGFEKIKKELNDLKDVTRPSTVERLATARMQGDLSENTEYAAARDSLAFIDGRIEELEEVLEKVVIIEKKSKKSDCVDLGCKVTVKAGSGESVYCIVGEWEADPSKKKVSHSSPLGQALLGKKVGDEVEFQAPAGKILFKILKIE